MTTTAPAWPSLARAARAYSSSGHPPPVLRLAFAPERPTFTGNP